MTVEQHNVIDTIHVEPSGNAVLTIADHLPWDEVNEHLYCLQEKLNAYLRFIESGEIYQKWPNAAGHPILIDVVMKYPAPGSAARFLEQMSAAIQAAGFKFNTRSL
jgi:hypothetical protein